MLSEILDANRNSFNLIRLVAAISVLISHAAVLHIGPGNAEPLSVLTPFTLGQHAVNVFFFISGLMLSFSLYRQPDLTRFARSRFLRVAPGLFGYGVIFALIVGPIVTSWTVADYLGNADTWFYPFSVLLKFAKATPPPGIFLNLPYAGAVNDPLWTIKYEVAVYIGLALLHLLRLSNCGIVLAALLMTSSIVFVITSSMSTDTGGMAFPYHMSRYSLCFLLGVAAFRYRERLHLSPWLLAISGAFVLATIGSKVSPIAYIIFTSHLVVVAASREYGELTLLTRRSDISYGTYIYGWPVQQLIVMLAPSIGAAALALLSVAVVLPFATLSWIWIEKPALAVKRW